MKAFIARYFCFIFLVITILNSGCGAFNKIGSNLMSGVNSKVDPLTDSLFKGLQNGLADPKTHKVITNLIDSILTATNNSLQPKVKGLVDSVLNKKILIWTDSLVQTVTGKKLLLNIAALQKASVGKSKDDIIKIRNSFESLFREIISDSTGVQVGKIRDNLLGAKTDSAISKIVDHATKTFIDRYKTDLVPTLNQQVSFISKYGIALLVITGVIAIVIILVIWWSKRRYVKMVNLLTKHISKIPNQAVYDKVTSNIKDEAVSAGLEPQLRQILLANGLIGNDHWNEKKN